MLSGGDGGTQASALSRLPPAASAQRTGEEGVGGRAPPCKLHFNPALRGPEAGAPTQSTAQDAARWPRRARCSDDDFTVRRQVVGT